MPIALTLVAFGGLAGCRGGDGSGASVGASVGAASAPSAASPASGAASGPAVAITVVAARQRPFALRLQATGTVTPIAAVEVRPRVSSAIDAIHVSEGQMVRQGQRLFTLDARADQAESARLAAALAQSEASLAQARRDLARQQELFGRQFVSQAAVDASRTQVDAQAAVVRANRAAMQAARVGLGLAHIDAPIAGRIGIVAVRPGSVVQANQTTLLTITQMQPIDVAFAIPQDRLGEALAAWRRPDGPARAASATPANAPMPSRAASATADAPPPAPGAAVLATLDGADAPLEGRLNFIDSQVSPASGTVVAKARFANEPARLWPGAFVPVAMTLRTLDAAVVVPQAALIQERDAAHVYVVRNGRAQRLKVAVLGVDGPDVAVDGVPAGASVIVDGRQNVRPDSPVQVRPPAAGSSTPAASAARDPGDGSRVSVAASPGASGTLR